MTGPGGRGMDLRALTAKLKLTWLGWRETDHGDLTRETGLAGALACGWPHVGRAVPEAPHVGRAVPEARDAIEGSAAVLSGSVAEGSRQLTSARWPRKKLASRDGLDLLSQDQESYFIRCFTR